MANDEQNLFQLLESSQHENPYVRLHAIQSLAESSDPRSIPALLAALDDPEAPVRATAITALGGLRAGQARWQILEQLGDKEPEVRLAAVEALGKIANPDTVPGLSLVLRKSQDSSLKVATVNALSQIGGVSALAVLQAAARDDFPNVRDAAVRAATSIQREEARGESIIKKIPFRRRLVWLLPAASVLLLVTYTLRWIIPVDSAPSATQPAVAQVSTLTTIEEAFVEDKMEGKSPDFSKLILGYDDRMVYVTIIFNSGISQLDSGDFVYMNGTHWDMIRLGTESFTLERDGGGDGHFEEIVYSGSIKKIPTDAIGIEIPREYLPDIAEKEVWGYSMQSQDRIPDEGELLLPTGSLVPTSQSTAAQVGQLTMIEEAFVEDKMEGKGPDFRKLIVGYDDRMVYVTIIFNSGANMLMGSDFVRMYGTRHDTIRLTYGSFTLERDKGGDGHLEETVYSGSIKKISTNVIGIEIPREYLPDIMEKRVWGYSMQSQDRIPDEGELLLSEAALQ